MKISTAKNTPLFFRKAKLIQMKNHKILEKEEHDEKKAKFRIYFLFHLFCVCEKRKTRQKSEEGKNIIIILFHFSAQTLIEKEGKKKVSSKQNIEIFFHTFGAKDKNIFIETNERGGCRCKNR